MKQPPPEDFVEAKYDPLAALRQPSFLLYTLSRIFATVGQTLLQAVILWQVYDLSGSAVSIGLVGLIRFLPALTLSLIGGAVADTYNRRNIVIFAQAVPLIGAAVLATATFSGWVSVEVIYVIVLFIGVASAFEAPARNALLPAIVKPDTFANAVTVSSTLQALGMVSGPALGGIILAAAGEGVAYSVYVAFATLAVITLASLRYKQDESQKRGVSFEAVREGIHFVRTRQVLIGAMTLDMVAVLFGGAQALLPIYARDILQAGPVGYGILSSSLEAGSFLMSIVMVLRPPVLKTGKTLIWAVIFYGAFTMAFGISRIFALSVVFYGLIGAADQVSMVMRSTTIQLATPDTLRGRVSAVSMIFINASNQVGAMESGFAAALLGATFAVTSGGFVAITVAALIGWRMKDLYSYRLPRQAGVAVPLGSAAHSAVGEPAGSLVEEPTSAAGGS